MTEKLVSIATRRKRNGGGRGFLSIETALEPHALRPKLNPCDVLEEHVRPILIGTDNDLLELFWRG